MFNHQIAALPADGAGSPARQGPGPGTWRRILLRAILILALLIPAGLAGITMAQAAGCSGYRIIPYSDGSWGKTLTLPSGYVVGYTKNASNGSCTGRWYEHMLLTDTRYTFEMNIWGPTSTRYRMGPWTNAWQDTASLRAGGTYCAGAHIYERNGRWLKWQYLGCFNT